MTGRALSPVNQKTSHNTDKHQRFYYIALDVTQQLACVSEKLSHLFRVTFIHVEIFLNFQTVYSEHAFACHAAVMYLIGIFYLTNAISITWL